MADYIIAYDITHPRRLGRVYRLLCKVAVPIEYSVFYASLDARQISSILHDLQEIIDPKTDDLRCYPPARVKIVVASFMQPTAEYGYPPNAFL